MKIFIINLERSTERKEHMIKELEKHNITNYEFFNGMDARENDYSEHVDFNKFKESHKRTIKVGEIGCALSHIRLYEKIVELNEPCIILEDDLEFLKNSDKINNFSFSKPFDVIFFNDHHAKNIFPNYGPILDTRLEQGLVFEKISLKITEIRGLVPCWLGTSYAISPSAAQKILNYNYPIKTVADSWFRFPIENVYHSKPAIFKQMTKHFGTLVQ